MKKWLVLLLLSSSLFGKEHVLDTPENHFQTSTPHRISPHVNPITGDLIEEEIDLVVAGIEPLSLRRFYNHTAAYDPRYGGWRYNPESFLVANFEWHEQECFAAAGGCARGLLIREKPMQLLRVVIHDAAHDVFQVFLWIYSQVSTCLD